MANFVVLVDADRSRRERFLKEIENHIAPVPGLATGGVAAGDLAAVWAAAPNAPISSIEGAGTAAVVWGDAIRGPGRQRMVAADLAVLWHDVDRPATFDGFHAAFSYSESGRLTAGVDVLGLFPLYYASAKGVLIVGSSPELFRRHPLFPALVDQEGWSPCCSMAVRSALVRCCGTCVGWRLATRSAGRGQAVFGSSNSTRRRNPKWYPLGHFRSRSSNSTPRGPRSWHGMVGVRLRKGFCSPAVATRA
jgi:hypothetical protein